MSESFAAKRSLPPPGQSLDADRATPRIAALMAELIDLAQERCARCGRILRHPVTVDGITYGRICATKVLPPALTWKEVSVPVVGGVATLPDCRTVSELPPHVQALIVHIPSR